MVPETKTAHALYSKLLTLYPRAFREQLGETMEQTFNDLYTERKQQEQAGLLGFTLWMFGETSLGIVREYFLLITKGSAMKNVFITLRSPAVISLLLVIPFMIMEIVNRRNLQEDFPIPLFVILWLLPVAFILISMPIVRSIRAGNRLLANPVGLFVRVMFLGLIAFMWFGILIDQIPCFLGVPNCD